MNQIQANALEKNLSEFKRLSEVLSKLRDTHRSILMDDPTGPCNQSPFTGNTRESRRVLSMIIHFSNTLGGAHGVSKTLEGLDLPAWEFGRYLKEYLEKRIEEIQAEIAKL